MDAEKFSHYKTCIKRIDDEHFCIIELIEKIAKCSKNNDVVSGKRYIKELLDLKNIHFFEEERMMEEVNFPYIKYHKSEHRGIISTLQQIDIDFGIKTINFDDKLTMMILNHIDNYDSQYVPYYNSWLASQK